MKQNSIAFKSKFNFELKATLQPFKSALFQYFSNFSDRNSSKAFKRQAQNTNHLGSNDFFQNLIEFINKKQIITEVMNDHSEPCSSDDQEDFQDELLNQKKNSAQIQTSYSFLRNIWGSHYFSRVSDLQNNDDRLDKINKIVAMMKQRINYMSKKESYLYEKGEVQTYKKNQSKLVQNNESDKQKLQLGIGCHYVFNNPIFQRLKQDSQKVKMQNEQHKRLIQTLRVKISQLQQTNQNIQTNFKLIKKKNQQLELRLIQNGKKNLNLEREIIDLKSDTYKLKEKARQLDDIKSACSDSAGKKFMFDNNDFYEPNQLNQYIQEPRSLLRVSSGNLEDQTFKSIILRDKLQSFNQKDDKLTFKSVFKSSYRYSSQFQENGSTKVGKQEKQNQQQLAKIKEPLKNTTLKYSNQGKLTLSSSKMDFKQQMPLNFRYIKETGSARKSLLSSVKSVDNFDKQSISKLKFERTKPTGSNVQRNGRKCSEDITKSGMISNVKKKCWAVTGNDRESKIL